MIFIAHRNGVWHPSLQLFTDSHLVGFFYVCSLYQHQLGGIEFDVRSTLDHELIIHHDPLIQTSTGTLSISTSRFSDLRPHVSSLSSLLHSLRHFPDIPLFIELKEKGCEFSLFLLLHRFQRLHNTRILSFDATILQKCFQYRSFFQAPDLKLGQNIETLSTSLCPVADFFSWHWKIYLLRYVGMDSRSRISQKPHYIFTINSKYLAWIFQHLFQCQGIFTDTIPTFLSPS